MSATDIKSKERDVFSVMYDIGAVPQDTKKLVIDVDASEESKTIKQAEARELYDRLMKKKEAFNVLENHGLLAAKEQRVIKAFKPELDQHLKELEKIIKFLDKGEIS